MTGYQVNISKNKTSYTTFKETMTLETTTFKETVNFGIGGDRSQHALCRAMNGEIQPNARCVAVNVGNTNIDRDPPSKITDDTIAIGRKFQEVLRPKVKVMLAGLLPRDEGYSFRRDRKQEVNTYLRNYCKHQDSKRFYYLPPDKQFAPGTNGHINRNLFLHQYPKLFL